MEENKMEFFIDFFANKVAIKLNEIIYQSKNEYGSKNEDTSFELITTQEASKLYKVHLNTIRNWVKTGELQSERLGNKIFIKIKK